MPRIGNQTGPNVALSPAFIPRPSNDALISTARTQLTARIAAVTRIVPTAPRAGHPIIEAYNPLTGQVEATQS